uniref:Tektin n=1 Tax=Stegastes partitus TaxID=144197 RepID=A0A3B5AM13_9TELE
MLEKPRPCRYYRLLICDIFCIWAPNVSLPRLPIISIEVRQIDATVASLHQQLSEARGSLSHLEESRMALEKDISCKTHSLFIEREKCMTHRKRYPTVSALSGY